MNSISVTARVRRQRFAKKNTVTSVLIPPLHHNQLAYTPCSRTIPATNRGVSEENVVATMDVPAMYHGRERPATKNSAVPAAALLAKYAPMPSAAAT